MRLGSSERYVAHSNSVQAENETVDQLIDGGVEWSRWKEHAHVRTRIESWGVEQVCT